MSSSALALETQALWHEAVDWGVVGVFALVYLGMFLGGLPRLKLNRPGVALLGAIAMMGLGVVSTEEAVRAVDWPTLMLLFAFMVLAAQMHLGGFFTAVVDRLGQRPMSQGRLLAALIAVAGALSAVFSNDVVCLAMAPLVARICVQRRLAPVPFLVGLACAANIGSAATLIGNPQNMLIGSVMQLDFGRYARLALGPVAASLVVLWAWLRFAPLGLAARATPAPSRGAVEPASGSPLPAGGLAMPAPDRWQMLKGWAVALALMAVFLATDWPREAAALVGAGILLLSRRFHSSQVMGLVDWELLVLFVGLFVVNHGFASTGLAAHALAQLAAHGVHIEQPGVLLVLALSLSNLVSNVPAVMLLLPHVGGEPAAVLLALVSTLAGNLLLVGSIANLIVVDAAQALGIDIGWRDHARIGIPITLFSLAIVWIASR
jgi:Na+/H+ antiporter NhaD/arsenite permease-like protein